ncbi:RNA-directed DNA polymerase [Paenibacillus sp. OK076]|uniref:RNA-directed DNA polymerase n=1 Tax=Paenibacillus sp. OK076 TaxID=1884379 RepID=UPI0008C74B89|nr:RNA-directed DNA polymerase [Paenibacillus sp. OK076]SEN67447.1 Retron-type reverse transcriptase [Paenibacillus sp. OK076]
MRLSTTSLDWALEHATKYGYVEFFPSAFEFDAMRHDWSNIRSWLSTTDLFQWQTRALRRCLSPKHRYGFRISTQLDPVDFLIYSALIYEIGTDLEHRRIPTTSETVHSYRFNPQPDGTMFDQNFTFDTFIHKAERIADEGGFSHVIVADIADFFPRLYSHRIENALSHATSLASHVSILKRLLSQWNERYSYGIPVGIAASRLIAEIALDDVDQALLSEGVTYVRYCDDFRIFCNSEREAHHRLSFLAEILFENHGLTLQQNKTKIIGVEDFLENHLRSERRATLSSLSERFEMIIRDAGIDLYSDIVLEDLTFEQREQIDNMDLEDILREQASKDDIDISLTRFILRRLGQLDATAELVFVLDNADKFYPVFTDVVRMAKSVRSLNESARSEIGSKFLALLGNDAIVSHLEFHRMWILNLFSENTEWDNETRLPTLFGQFTDQFSQRELILSMGRAHHEHWFRARKRTVFDFNPWMRRALLAAGSCLPKDERTHWFRSLERRLDPLELAVVKWAQANPF